MGNYWIAGEHSFNKIMGYLICSLLIETLYVADQAASPWLQSMIFICLFLYCSSPTNYLTSYAQMAYFWYFTHN